METGLPRASCVRLAAMLGAVPFALGVAASPALAASPVDKLEDFPLDQVQITDDYQKNLFAKDVTYLITTLDSDRLMAGFKAVSEGGNPTNLYGGWESTNIRGHTLGHWLSAMAHAYEQALGSDPTLAAQIKTKLDDVIAKLGGYQLSSGFLFASPISEFDAFDNGTGGWVPYYTLHKIFAGLLDVHVHEQNAAALSIASKLGDWLYARTAAWSTGARSRVLGQEYGGLNDSLYELYKYTTDPDHLAVAHVFDDTSLFTTLAGGTDNLSGKHANTTIPKFIGALNRYRTLGTAESSYLDAASGFLGVVLKNHTYVTGGNSQDEHFRTPNALNQNRDSVNNETCNAYNMSKLTRDLFKVTGDIQYADFYERIHINEILASMNPETGMTTYFKAMGTGFFKVFGTPTNHFWCCTGTGMENFAKLGDSVYFHDDEDLWVTYYVSSTLNWKERGLSLTQTTDLPLTNRVTFTITAAPADAVSLNFRKPDWTSTCQMAVAVNGQTVTATESGGFISVSRAWQPNDTVELAFPLFVQASRLQDNPNAVAFTYGPLVLSAGLGTDSMTTEPHGVQVLAATKPSGLDDSIELSGGTVNEWIANIQSNLVRTPDKLEFRLENTDSDDRLVFTPHFSRYQDRYGIYWLLSGSAGPTTPTNLVCPTVTAGDPGGAGGTGGTSGTGGAGGTSGSVAGGVGGSSGAPSSTAGAGSGAVAGSAGGAIAGASGNQAGTTASGGATASGGTTATGGQSSGGVATGTAGSGGAGAGHSGSAASANDSAGSDSTGCACTVGTRSATQPWLSALALGLALGARRRGRSVRLP